MVRRQSKDIWKRVQDEIHKRNAKTITDFGKKKYSPKQKKQCEKSKSKVSKPKKAVVDSSPLSVKLDLENSEDDDLLSAGLIATPTVAKFQSDSDDDDDDDTEEQDDPDPDDYKALLGHQKKSGNILVKVQYYNGQKEWVHIAFVHVDAPALLKAYVKQKDLRDNVWTSGKKDGDRILAVLEHQGSGKHQKLKVLWNNGYVVWKPLPFVMEQVPDMVNRFLAD